MSVFADKVSQEQVHVLYANMYLSYMNKIIHINGSGNPCDVWFSVRSRSIQLTEQESQAAYKTACDSWTFTVVTVKILNFLLHGKKVSL